MKTAARPPSEISHSVAHYLMAIDALDNQPGDTRASDIARELDVSRNAVSLKLQSLTAAGLVAISAKKHISLSASGKHEVENIISTRRAVQHLLTDLLGVSPETAEDDACRVEHLLSHETSAQLIRMFLYLQQDSAEAQAFIGKFQEFSHTCADDEECAVCHHRCFLHQ